MESTGWLLELVSLLACGFKLHGIFTLFYQIFVCRVCSKENMIFIAFYKKIWPYDDAITALWQNQIIIVYSMFLKCLNKVFGLGNEDYP